jgi:transcriptional regulator with XRE-family HTH domain
VSGHPTPYRELGDVISNLPLLLREARRARGLSLRGAARELGMSFATVTRMEKGEDCALSNAVAVLRWLDHTEEQA